MNMNWHFVVLAVQLGCLGYQLYELRRARRYRSLLAMLAARSFMLTAAPIYKIWSQTMGAMRIKVETMDRNSD